MLHLICGPMGAGKTTYAMHLADKHHAVRFSEDEWLANLFVPEAPDGLIEQPMPVIVEWAAKKYDYCRAQITLMCRQCLNSNVNVVLDGAAANVGQRDAIRQLAKAFNTGFTLHFINALKAVRHTRIFERNKNQGATYSQEVTPTMFEYVESMVDNVTLFPEYDEAGEVPIWPTS